MLGFPKLLHQDKLAILWLLGKWVMCDLVVIVVADDALVFGQAQLAALICCQSKGGQEARS